MSEQSIHIRPAAPGDAEAVLELIVPIQREEFAIPISAADQPDLHDIGRFYQHGAGNFWIALRNGQVVGTVALLDIGAGNGALRKMFVRSDARGATAGVAHRLLETLLAWASAQGLHTIYLGTTAKFLAAHRFYEKHGFVEIERAELPPSFPVMQVDSKFYRYSIGSRSGTSSRATPIAESAMP